VAENIKTAYSLSNLKKNNIRKWALDRFTHMIWVDNKTGQIIDSEAKSYVNWKRFFSEKEILQYEKSL
jgi:hypothetical protein